MPKLTVPDRLRALADLYELKNKEYGNAYKHVGDVAAGLQLGHALGGDGAPLQWSKIAILCVMMYKLQRYCHNSVGGHSDSLDDLAVYAMMLREIDDEGS